MSRCFISYRHVTPDQDLAHAIGASLMQNGHSVFLDTKLQVGTRWVDEIEHEIRAAQYFAVLLSEQSIHSDMVRQEVAFAHELCTEGKLCLLPIRVAYTARLPYDLAAYLNPFQHTLWHVDEPFDRVCREIQNAVNHQTDCPPGHPIPVQAIHFEPASLDNLARELAVFVGPVARVLVNRAARHAQSWQQLQEALAAEIPTGEERKLFLAKRASH